MDDENENQNENQNLGVIIMTSGPLLSFVSPVVNVIRSSVCIHHLEPDVLLAHELILSGAV